jgi:UDP-glucose 4-epimerase
VTQTTRWVVGRGLLGRAIERARETPRFEVTVPWDDPAASVNALGDGVLEFARSEGALELYWAAGRGVTSTPAQQLDVEARVFEDVVTILRDLPADVRSRLTVFLASSVGGAYAGSGRPPFTEASPTLATSPYGEAKLRMEAALAAGTEHGGWRSFIARITNIYGAGQDLTKPQGLISALVRGHLSGQPISVYVPLDTLRDYIYEDDCAAIVDAAMRRVRTQPAGTTVVKVVGSMRAVSIGALLSELTRLRRRRGPIVLGGGDARGQSLDLRVRSDVWTDLDGLARTSLPEGLSRVFQAQLSGRANPL